MADEIKPPQQQVDDEEEEIIELPADEASEAMMTTELFDILESGDLEQLKLYKESGKSLEGRAPNPFRDTAVHLAAVSGKLDMLRFLHEHGLSIYAENRDGKTPAHLAAANSRLDVLEYLREVDKTGEVLLAVDREGNSLVHCAETQEVVDYLRDLGLNADADESRLSRELLAQVRSGDLEAVHQFHQAGKKVRGRTRSSETVMHIAADVGQVKILRFLHETAGLPVAPEDNEGDTPAHAAAMAGQTDVLKYLQEVDPSLLTARDYLGRTPAHFAAQGGSVEALELLLDTDPTGETLTALDDEEKSLMHYTESQAVAELLTQRGLPVSVDESRLSSELISLIKAGDADAIKAYHDAGNKVRGCYSDDDMQQLTAVHFASAMGSCSVLKYLDECGLALDATDSSGRTAAHLAAQNGSAEVLAYLHERNPELLSVKDYQGRSPAHLASLHGSLDALRMLLERRPELSLEADHFGKTPLQYADSTEACRLLTEAGCPTPLEESRLADQVVDMLMACELDQLRQFAAGGGKLVGIYSDDSVHGFTAAHFAAGVGSREIVDFLHSQSVGLTATNEDGTAPVHLAARNGRLSVLEYLVEKNGATVLGQPDAKGRTPAHFATLNGHIEVMKFIDQQDPSGELFLAIDNDGKTLMHFAESGEIARFLAEKGVKTSPAESILSQQLFYTIMSGDLDAVKKFATDGGKLQGRTNDEHRGTAVHVAALKGNVALVEFLHQQGLSLDSEDSNGDTAAHFAAMKGHTELLEFLCNACQDENDPCRPLRVRNIHGQTPGHLAALNGHLGALQFIASRDPSGELLKSLDDTGRSLLQCTDSADVCDFLEGHGVTSEHEESRIPKDLINILMSGELEFLKQYQRAGKRLKGITVSHFVSMLGHLELLKFLHGLGVSLVAKNREGITPAHLAARSGHVHILRYIREQSPDAQVFEAKDASGQTPAHLAALTGQLQVLEYLLTELGNQSCLQVVDDSGRTLMHCTDSAEIVAFLKEHGVTANVNASRLHQDVIDAVMSQDLDALKAFAEAGGKLQGVYRGEDVDGFSSGHFAAAVGSIEILQFLNDNGVRLDLLDADGATPAHLAARNGHLEALKLIQSLWQAEESGDFLRHTDSNGRTMGHLAAMNGHLDILKHLHELDESKTVLQLLDADERSLIHYTDSGPVVEFLTSCGVQTSIDESRLSSQLIRILQSGSVQRLRDFLESGGKLRGRTNDHFWNTAAHVAAVEDRADLLAVIHSVEPRCLELRNFDGCTPGHLAARSGSLGVLRFVRETDADLLHELDFYGAGLLHYASSPEVLQFLLVDGGLDPFAADDNGGTVGHAASLNGCSDVLQCLRDHPELRRLLFSVDSTGRTPMHYAESAEVVEIFQEAGLDTKPEESRLSYDLFNICMSGDLQSLQEFHACGYKLLGRTADRYGGNAAHVATVAGHLPVLRFLAENGIDIAFRDYEGNTPAHLAVWANDLEILRFLIAHDKKGELLEATDIEGRTPMHLAESAEITTFIERCGSKTPKSESRLPAQLVSIIRSGDLSALEAYYEAGGKIIGRTIDAFGDTAVHIAAMEGRSDMIRFLHAHGLDVTAINKADNVRPVHLAALKGQLDVLRFILELSGLEALQAETEGGSSCMHCAVQGGNLEAVKFLRSEVGLPVDKKNASGTAPAHFAARYGRLDILQYLESEDPSGNLVQVRDGSNQTLMHYASTTELVRYLNEKGLSTLAVDDNGATPGHWAAQYNLAPVLRLLCDFNKPETVLLATDNRGETPGHIAALNGAFEVLQLIKELDTDGKAITATDKMEQSLLHYASSTQIAKFLLDCGLSLSAKDANGATPGHYAAKNGRLDLLAFLIEQDPSGQLLRELDSTGNTLMHYAEDTEVVDFLHQNGLPIRADESRLPSELIDIICSGSIDRLHRYVRAGKKVRGRCYEGCYGGNALHVAAGCGSIRMVHFFEDVGFSLASTDLAGNTVAHFAALYGHVNLLEYLLARDPSKTLLSLRDYRGRTPAHLAALTGSLEVLKFLRSLDEDGSLLLARDFQGDSLMHYASSAEVANFLIESDVKTSVEESRLSEAAIDAVLSGDEAEIKRLYESGEKLLGLYAEDGVRGFNLCHIAAIKGHGDAFKFLHSVGIDAKAANSQGATPAHLAARAGCLPILQFLLTVDPDLLKRRDVENQTPMHYTESQEVAEFLAANGVETSIHESRLPGRLIEILVDGDLTQLTEYHKAGNKLCGRTSNWNSAAHIAVVEDKLDALKYLNENGVRLDTRNRRGCTPGHLAALNGRLEALRYLLSQEGGKDAAKAVDAKGLSLLHYASTAAAAELLVTEAGLNLTLAMTKAPHRHTRLHLMATPRL
uniref:ANK_REP_REGION domain-containing protein n=1 Tax=Macrostomum lignano TaxID=282301 RepID=A0A1I8J392_9PLAT